MPAKRKAKPTACWSISTAATAAAAAGRQLASIAVRPTCPHGECDGHVRCSGDGGGGGVGSATTGESSSGGELTAANRQAPSTLRWAGGLAAAVGTGVLSALQHGLYTFGRWREEAAWGCGSRGPTDDKGLPRPCPPEVTEQFNGPAPPLQFLAHARLFCSVENAVCKDSHRRMSSTNMGTASAAAKPLSEILSRGHHGRQESRTLVKQRRV